MTRHRGKNKPNNQVKKLVDEYLSNTLKDVIANQNNRRALSSSPITTRQNNNIMRLPYRAAQNKRTANPWITANLPVGISDEGGRLDLRSIRSRARTFELNNKYAKAILLSFVDNVIGANGFGCRAITSDPEWNKQANLCWDTFTDIADCQGGTWIDLQRVLVKSEQRDGDICVVMLDTGDLQAIEGHRLRSPADKGTRVKAPNRIVDGVEINALGRPIAYWFSAGDTDDAGDPQRVDAKDVIFLAREKSLSATRGESIFTNIADTLDVINDLEDTALIKEKIAACYSLIYKLESPQDYVDSQPYMLTDAGSNPHKGKDLYPGMIDTIGKDESVEQLEPKASGQNLTEFMRQGIRSMGAAVRIPYEHIQLDFSQGNFSSVRAALLQSHVTYRREQKRLEDRFLKRVYRWQVDRWIEQGLLKDSPEKYKVQFIPQGFAYLDPTEDIKAKLIERDAGLKTHSQQLQENGINYDDWVNESGYELAAKRDNGLPNTHSMLTGDFDQFKTTLPLPDQQRELHKQIQSSGELTNEQ